MTDPNKPPRDEPAAADGAFDGARATPGKTGAGLGARDGGTGSAAAAATVLAPAGPLSPLERRAAWSLSLIYVVRMLGLFIILPVFSLFADDYAYSTPLLVGLAIGIYGLLQAALQIPFGMLSDRIGRKRVVTIGLLLLALGSVIAASADDIRIVILGRALQGAGAIAAALMALAADLTRDEQRTKVMAMLGASIGLSFILALILGPVLIGWYSIDVLFWLTALCAVLGIVLLHTVVPDAAALQLQRGHRGEPRDHAAAVLPHHAAPARRQHLHAAPADHRHLLRRAAGAARGRLRIDSGSQWQVYLPAVVVSVALMVPLVDTWPRSAPCARCADRLSVAGMLGVQILVVRDGGAGRPVGRGVGRRVADRLGITLFFGFLNTLEALLPSLVSRLAPAAAKGSAMGIYSPAASSWARSSAAPVPAGCTARSASAVDCSSFWRVLCAAWIALVLAGFTPPSEA